MGNYIAAGYSKFYFLGCHIYYVPQVLGGPIYQRNRFLPVSIVGNYRNGDESGLYVLSAMVEKQAGWGQIYH